MKKDWKAVHLPNDTWEVAEYTYYFSPIFNDMVVSSYKTIVRGVTQDQAVTIMKEHNATNNERT